MKTYRIQQSIGKARHVVSYHDGEKKHGDGSPFFDVEVCGNKRTRDKFVRSLKAQGYSEA